MFLLTDGVLFFIARTASLTKSTKTGHEDIYRNPPK